MNRNIIELRHFLHKYPEVSNREYKTMETITGFVNTSSPDEVLPICKTGKAFIYKGKLPGKTLMFRAELDALPITEHSSHSYASVNKNVAHLCGHDGHMAILAGLSQMIAAKRPERGKVILLFQPAEEVEQGARDVVGDPVFQSMEADYIFALHNIPGAEKHRILLKTGSFAAASKGMTIKLIGKTSHAAEPENGISPENAISMIIKNFHELWQKKQLFKDMVLLTIIHICMGEISFGTSPGYAELRITLRAFENDDMERLTREAEKIIHGISEMEKLRYEIAYNEVFPATVNNPDCVNIAARAAKEHNLKVEFLQKPFKWSEDFAYYTQKYNTCLFGLGGGVHLSQLHNPDYDFPDEIMDTGMKVFYKIYQEINFSDHE